MLQKIKKYISPIFIILLLILGLVIAITFHKYDIFGLTSRGKFHTYYGTKLELPRSAFEIQEYSDVAGFPADGTEVMTFKASSDDIQKLLSSMPFNGASPWQKGPYSEGCLEGFLQPCNNQNENMFHNPDKHVTIQNTDGIYYSEISPEDSGHKVLILDIANQRVLAYKYSY